MCFARYFCGSSKRKADGFALLSVLWVTAFLAVIAATLVFESRTNARLVRNNLQQFTAEQINTGKILSVVADLLGANSSIDIEVIEQRNAQQWSEAATGISVIDESGKIDLNISSAEMLMALFVQSGVDQDRALQLTNSVLDWRDEDDQTRVSGAENTDYLRAGLQYGPSNKDFERIEELQLVLGMDLALYQRVSPYITIYSQDLGVNPAIASPRVRAVIDQAQGFHSLFNRDADIQLELEDYVTSTSGYIYSIVAHTRTKDGIDVKTSAIVRLDRGNAFQPFTILRWNQG